MVKIQVDITKEADTKLKIYMAKNDINDKRTAVNQILEEIENE